MANEPITPATETGQGTEGLTPEVVLGALESNPELSKQVESQFLNPEKIQSFLDTDQGKTIIAPRLDSFASKAIESWKAKNLDDIVTQRMNELNPPETEDQRQLRAMQSQLAEIKAEKDRLAMNSVAQQALQSVGLPATLADYVMADTPEATKHNANALDAEIQNLVTQRLDEKVKNIASQSAPSNQDNGSGVVSKEVTSLYDLSPVEAAQLKASNPAKYEALKRNS